MHSVKVPLDRETVARFFNLQVALTQAQQPECSCPGSVPRRRRGERGSSLPPPQPSRTLTGHPGSGKKEEGGGAVREFTPPAALRKVLSSSTCVQKATRGSPGGRHAPFQSGNPRAPRRGAPETHPRHPKSCYLSVPRARPETGLSRQWVACLREPGVLAFPRAGGGRRGAGDRPRGHPCAAGP